MLHIRQALACIKDCDLNDEETVRFLNSYVVDALDEFIKDVMDIPDVCREDLVTTFIGESLEA